MWVMGLGLGLWENLRVTPAAFTIKPIIARVHIVTVMVTSCVLVFLSDVTLPELDRYDVVSLTEALRGFLLDLPAPLIPDAIYSELLCSAQGNRSLWNLSAFFRNFARRNAFDLLLPASSDWTSLRVSHTNFLFLFPSCGSVHYFPLPQEVCKPSSQNVPF